MTDRFMHLIRIAAHRVASPILGSLLLASSFTSHAQLVPAELDRACPNAFSADPLAWVAPDVSAPAHMVDVSLEAPGQAPRPYRFTVWRTPCPGDVSRTRAWLRVSDPTGIYRDFLQLPIVTVLQSGRVIGSFATRVSYRQGGAAQDYFALTDQMPSGSLGSTGPMSGALINTNPTVSFDPSAPITLLVRRGDAGTAVQVDVPDARAPGNIGFMPRFIAGHWWTPSRPGSGLVLSRNERETLYAAWMTYDDNGRATWFVMLDGLPTGDGRIAGKVYAPRGPAYPSPANPNVSNSQRVELGPQVGTFSFRFKDAGHAEFAWDVQGVQHVQQIEKLNIGDKPDEPLYVCDTNTGVWLSSVVNGWGIGISGSTWLRGCSLHTALLTYDNAGTPTWYFAALADDGRTSTVYTFLTNLPRELPIKSGAVYQPTGTPFRDVNAPASVHLGAPVGSLESVMVSTEQPSFRYRINGVPLNLDLRLFRFEY